ncbi:hypothetical protein GOP47_0008602 [Adiantum capillus-veneris]|uniref:Uncharacterized protein n=1 Tax=Adiantum capillus-veneris TaxID=13818 RepID=A0A9D4ZJW1_ADICA|nr:hypothetical protein GOP47_0008602 [Adiantum capillus-veneris]
MRRREVGPAQAGVGRNSLHQRTYGQNRLWPCELEMLPFILVLQENLRQSPSLHTWAVLIASFFVLVALSLSFVLIFAHLTHYTKPQEQKWLIGVVFMVPVYSVESFASLWNPNISIECDILRNCYEAFALYSFGNYLIACMGGEEEILEFFEKKFEVASTCGRDVTKAAMHHPFPLKFLLAPWMYGHNCFKRIKFGIVQYMIMKTLCALLSLILELCGVYGDGEFNWNYGYPYITIAMNFSQMWALYCLVQFYNTTYEELKPIKPLAKFLCFKAIVFATWWQGVIIALLCAFNVIPGSLGTSKFQSSLQDFIICIEMAVAAVAHTFVFPVTPYQASFNQPKNFEYSVNSHVPSREPLLKVNKVEEYDGGSYRRLINADVNVSGTSLTESVQDVVLGGGETVSAVLN